jgi:hypothetical protein
VSANKVLIGSGTRLAFAQCARLACEQATKNIEPRRVLGRDGKSVYLERYYLFGGPSEDGAWADEPVGVYLHHFMRSDEDGELHNHPWAGSVSLILAGGYEEERRVGDEVVRKRYDPFDVNVIKANDFHRVDLIEKDAWTLFVVGAKAQSWGFWNRDSKLFMPWREFIATRRGIDLSNFDVDDIKRTEDLVVAGFAKEPTIAQAEAAPEAEE